MTGLPVNIMANMQKPILSVETRIADGGGGQARRKPLDELIGLGGYLAPLLPTGGIFKSKINLLPAAGPPKSRYFGDEGGNLYGEGGPWRYRSLKNLLVLTS